jgi:hypothetical protein
VIFIAAFGRRVASYCGCGKQAVHPDGWILYAERKPMCEECAAKQGAALPVLAAVRERLPMERYCSTSIVIGAQDKFEIACPGREHQCREIVCARRIEFCPNIPFARAPLCLCLRCLASSYPEAAALLRELNGQPPAEPEPAPAPPVIKMPTASQIAARQRAAWRVSLAECLRGFRASGDRMPDLDRGEQLLATIEQIMKRSPG